jgi:hypothetical protein
MFPEFQSARITKPKIHEIPRRIQMQIESASRERGGGGIQTIT